ncbi:MULTISPECIES: hypothetical protein, partial [unclassified Microcoleus]|uniref:hypothetical protein n=1 Tax=unclassified Microcoleus TaxID=2642155 RepID=UPI001D4F6676
QQTGLPVTTGTGGQTQYNRTRMGLPKTHWLDAADRNVPTVGRSLRFPRCGRMAGVKEVL